ncbi:uncharacterized protein LOC132902733 [Amyelois transitella]|uniref:uncharacterized protein LOC132902733 n=1 Tax=Amyelois transitella TaxID=680683 RepID=UPI0029900650|nr:uncharacterized protein LOC132902733 [Amyelois transitella]
MEVHDPRPRYQAARLEPLDDLEMDGEFKITTTYSNDISKKVEQKIHDGDLRGATRLLFSNDKIAPDTPETSAALLSKHPPGPSTPLFVDPPTDSSACLHASEKDVKEALASFPKGSASGLDGISPQHLIDLTSYGTGVAGNNVLTSITKLINLMLLGDVCQDVSAVIYGANLIALTKKDGGIRPIAVGSTFRRLAAKVCVRLTRHKLQNLFEPVQVGFGTRGGCEAAVHAVRTFTHSNMCEVLLKLDVKNAFNSVNRDTLLNEIKLHVPELYNFLLQCYHTPSKLVHKYNEIDSATGCQQGDPLGPAIFSLAINSIIHGLNSKLNVWYLDDGTLGGDFKTVLKDLIDIKNKFSNIDSLYLLGSPIFDEAIPSLLSKSISKFTDYSDRLTKISSHSALFVLKFCLFIPKLTYLLRCCPIWKYPTLVQPIDQLLKNKIELILNISFGEEAWTQASLPIRNGGLGIRKISCVALPAFLSSIHSTSNLVGNILKVPATTNYEIACLDEATNAWLTGPSPNLPSKLQSQRAWDSISSNFIFSSLLENSFSRDRARLLAVSRPESGHWLHAYPSPALGTFLNPLTLRVAVGLRVGAEVCVDHSCASCGVSVDRLGHHGLACSSGAGRQSRHAALNDILRRALVSADVPVALEPQIVRDDGKRPDGMSLIPWRMGRALVWDATCADTLAASYLPATSKQAGAAADARERFKTNKYSCLGTQYEFVPFGVETLGPWGKGARELHKALSKRLREATGDPRAGSFLAQRIAIAIQRGNAACHTNFWHEHRDIRNSEEF